MRQIQFRLGLRPRPRLGSSQRSPGPIAGFKVPTSKGRGGQGREGQGRRRGGEGWRKGEEEGERGGQNGKRGADYCLGRLSA